MALNYLTRIIAGFSHSHLSGGIGMVFMSYRKTRFYFCCLLNHTLLLFFFFDLQLHTIYIHFVQGGFFPNPAVNRSFAIKIEGILPVLMQWEVAITEPISVNFY